MSTNDIDRTLAAWFEEDALAATPADGLDHALEGARASAQRPAWIAGLGSHWGWQATHVAAGDGVRVLPRSGFRWSPALIVVVVLGVVLLGGTIMVGARLLDAPTMPAPLLGRLAYAVDGDIFLADPDGQNPTRIADGLPGGKSGCGSAGFWAEGPMWSPDGRHLAYRSPRSQVDCDRPLADTFPTVLIADPTGKVVASVHGVGWLVSWSPDSKRVATWLDYYPGTAIGVYGLDGTQEARLEVPAGLEPLGDYDPVWSPDGESLLIRSVAKGVPPAPGNCPSTVVRHKRSNPTIRGTIGRLGPRPTEPRSPIS